MGREPAERQQHAQRTKLRRIMSNSAAPLHRRVDSAETIMAFEISAGGAVGVAPSEVAASSFKFLRAVVDASRGRMTPRDLVQLELLRRLTIGRVFP